MYWSRGDEENCKIQKESSFFCGIGDYHASMYYPDASAGKGMGLRGRTAGTGGGSGSF